MYLAVCILTHITLHLSQQSALSDISNLLSTVSNAGFFTPQIRRQIKASETEVDPAPGTVNPEDENVWRLIVYPHGMELINLKDSTLNMSITYEEDDDYEDRENILDDMTHEEVQLIEEEVEDVTSRMAALSTPGQATPQRSITGLAAQFPDRPVALRTTTIKIHPFANDTSKTYLARTPVPDEPILNIWTPSRGLPTTRQQARAAQQCIAMSYSPVGMVTRSCATQQRGLTGAREVRPLTTGGRGLTPLTPGGEEQHNCQPVEED